MAYRIKAGEEPAAEIRRIVREQAERALESARALGGPEDTKAIHSLRKRIKKMRAVLRLVRKQLGADIYREENQRLREVAHGFSRLRDADVQLGVVEKLRESAGLRLEAFAGTVAALNRLRDAAPGEEEARRMAVTMLESLGDRLEGWPLEGLKLEKLSCAFQKTYRKARKCLHHVLDHRSAANFHSWRKRTKNVWYQARILQELNPAVICAISEAADTLGGYLGDLHDLAFLRDQLNSDGEMPPAEVEVLLGLICRREKALEQIALDLGQRFFAEKPGSFGRRLLRYAADWPASP